MLAYMNLGALQRTADTGTTWFWSRSRREYWNKGATSGHVQRVVSMSGDCDGDALLIRVEQTGAACHTGAHSCFLTRFWRKMTMNDTIRTLYDTILDRRDHPSDNSYTRYLFDQGIDKILKKVGEESAEVIIAAKKRPS